MSIQCVETILERIKIATDDSPIAVFTLKSGGLEAVLESTVSTRYRVQCGDPDLIGVFTRADDLKQVRRILEGAIDGR